MEEFKFIIFLREEEIALSRINAKTKDDAEILVKQNYPPAKGYSYKLTNNVSN